MIIIEVIQSCPMALQLRYLQTLGSIASESKKTRWGCGWGWWIWRLKVQCLPICKCWMSKTQDVPVSFKFSRTQRQREWNISYILNVRVLRVQTPPFFVIKCLDKYIKHNVTFNTLQYIENTDYIVILWLYCKCILWHQPEYQ